jgi:hypothetical protein
MYIKPGCPYCQRAREHLAAVGEQVEERDATPDRGEPGPHPAGATPDQENPALIQPVRSERTLICRPYLNVVSDQFVEDGRAVAGELAFIRGRSTRVDPE